MLHKKKNSSLLSIRPNNIHLLDKIHLVYNPRFDSSFFKELLGRIYYM